MARISERESANPVMPFVRVNSARPSLHGLLSESGIAAFSANLDPVASVSSGTTHTYQLPQKSLFSHGEALCHQGVPPTSPS